MGSALQIMAVIRSMAPLLLRLITSAIFISHPFTMVVLVINCGSSSLKFSVISPDENTTIAHGGVECIGMDTTVGSLTLQNGEKQPISCPPGCDHHAAIQAALKALFSAPSMENVTIEAIGHRVVHGGESFADSVLIDDRVLATIKQLSTLAPLHNPANAIGIEATRALFPDLPQVAVFDTAFHQSIGPTVYRYAVPENLYRDYGVRRYGFHGTSHQYVTEQAVAILGLDPRSHRLLSAHLGNGCSATAVLNGKSKDTSMGITPLEGLVMGTRSGNVDPNLHHYLHSRTGMSLDAITDLLNKKSGLLGLSGCSNDLRTLTEKMNDGDPAASLAIEVFCFRIARELAGLIVALEGKPDALIFTGGIGENSRIVRAKILQHLAPFDFTLDPTANATSGAQTRGIISQPSHHPVAIVIPTNEELAIARATLSLIAHL